ncbi:MAG: DUF1513 domain-containing protein [Rubrivivax sp.]|nr:MAG: DUF1513 domain-containing protein [Rubrivivax sp.]
MPMAIDMISRRQVLAHGARGGVVAGSLQAMAWSAWAADAESATRLAATWAMEAGHHVGVLQVQRAGLRVQSQLAVPTRAHGLSRESAHVMLSVARRPGDWLLRWHLGGKPLTWCWVEPGRAFNGHALHSPDGLRVYTTETDLDTGAGWIALRDSRTLRKLQDWPTGGQDPHQMTWLPGAEGRRLIVANGGLATWPETGRQKVALDKMDSSLAVIETERGRLDGQWRVADRRLSLRHLAWHRHGPRPVLGIALQAEHDQLADKIAAPVLALWDGTQLRTAPSDAVPLAGYGGDIAAIPEGFAVSAPKAHAVGLWRPDGQWIGSMGAAQACALAEEADRLWVGEQQGAWQRTASQTTRVPGDQALRLDNHWLVI